MHTGDHSLLSHPKDFCRSWTEFDLGEFSGWAQNLIGNGCLSIWWPCSTVLNFRLLWASALPWNISDRISVCRIQGKEIHACNRKSSFSCVRTVPEVKVQLPQLCDNTILVCMTECTGIGKWLLSLPSHLESGKTWAMLPNNKQQTSLLSLNYIFAVGYLTFHKSKVMLLLWLSLESDLKIVVMMISFKILVYFRGGSSVVRIF